ncbi:type II toxin-antitoxin system RelE/ParE family toxin [Candidatus Uhrbacteria bacterium]|nr:type II toxin-antitoxin system RelE/ParE family toxin [Candidatus Uhrbacteria bacterium]
MRELIVTRQFTKDFRLLDPIMQSKAERVAQQLRIRPTNIAFPIKKLQGFARPPLWRVRLGDYRLIYTFDRTSVTLHRISHRKDVYRHL